MMPSDEANLDEAERWVDDWQSRIEARAATIRALSERLRDMTASASGGNGAVEVTVNSSGVLVGLWLDEGVRRHSAKWIAELVMSTTRSALGELARQAGAVAEETVGRDSVESRAVVQSFVGRLGQTRIRE
jgi:DNA-binding protein YbaB